MSLRTARKNLVNRAVMISLAAASVTSIQAFAEVGVEEVERIAVTGSRIKRSDIETASPITIIGSAEIKASGAVSVDAILQTLTISAGAMTNPGVNNGSGGNARVNLRGLGSQRTLVLLNGRRMINSGTGAASTVDLNTIPVSMISRIEVLKDGASAVYGTDAVAGVVNIILKKDFEGLDMNVQTGMSGQGDAEETTIDLTLGGSFDRGNVVIGIQYTERGEASQADRDFSSCPIMEREDANGNPELYCGGSSYSPGGHVWGPNDEDLQGNPDGSFDDFTDEDKYNYSEDSYLYTPMKRLNLTGLGTFELTDDTNVFAEFTYSKRWSDQKMAPQPIWFTFDYTEEMGDSLLEHGINYGDTVDYGRRMTDTGTRDSSQVVDTVRTVIGVEGILSNDWSWDVALNFGRNDSVDQLSNLHNMGAVQSDIVDGNFNPLDQAAWATENMSDYLYTEMNSGGSQLFMLSASIAGELMELPAGSLGFAAGIESRTEKAWFTPDSLTSQGLANDPKVDPTSGSFDVKEAYLELAIPLLSDVFLAESVELSAATRAFDYSTFGLDTTWKLGLTWKLNDEIMLRGVSSTAFRAPSVSELYSGNSPSYDQIDFDGAQDQAEVTRGGNDQLTPEEAETLTVGLVYEPSWFDGFSMTVDYYDISVSNAIGLVDSQYIVDNCLDESTGNTKNENSQICKSADIDFNTGTGRITFNNQLQNIGQEDIRGVDLSLNYKFEVAGLDWSTSLDTSFLVESSVVDADGNTIDYVGNITSGGGGYADVKSNLTITALGDDWNASYKARYLSGMDSFSCLNDPSACYAPTTPSMVYHDINATYMMTETVTLSGGVNNLFDNEPPYYTGNNDSNTDPYTYDVLGRYLYVNVNVKF